MKNDAVKEIYGWKFEQLTAIIGISMKFVSFLLNVKDQIAVVLLSMVL